jgi:adenine-specific DNA-methyltransferase
MYPRLYIAKQLLKDDGVIFISIDDNEVAQLRLLMDEIFGEENFVALAPRKTGAGSAATRSDSELRKLNDYVIIYQKKQLEFKQKYIGEKVFPYSDSHGNYLLAQYQASGSDATRTARPNMYYPIYLLKDGTLTTKVQVSFEKEIFPSKVNGQEGRWLWKPEKFEKDNKQYIHYESGKILRKVYFDSSVDNGIYQVEKAWIDQFTNASGTKSFNQLFEPVKGIFSNPKPIDLLIHLFNLIKFIEDEDIIILDFFAGSGTTGDAVMQLNAEDGGNRKYILVQIPQPIDSKKDKVAYDFVKNELNAEPTIFEITKERLIRAALKIQKEQAEKADMFEDGQPLDLGFKIFETYPIWEDYDFEEEKFDEAQVLFDYSRLTDEDIQSLLITWKTYDTIPLTTTLEKIDIGGYSVYYAEGKLYMMDKGFTTEHLKNLLEKIDFDPRFEPKTISAFGFHFESKSLREISENVKSYNNKKNTDIDFLIRY